MIDEEFDILLRNIKRLLGIKKDRELAGKLGITPQAVAGAKRKGTIPDTWLDTLEERYNLPREKVARLHKVTATLETRYSSLVPVIATPLLGRVPAGIPEQIEEQVEDYVSFPGVVEGTYALRAHGESMVPAIRHDDFVLFRIDQDVRPGQVVVVNNEFGESMLKRLKEKDGELWLTSDNPEYPAVRPNDHYRIMGVVVRVIRDIPF